MKTELDFMEGRHALVVCSLRFAEQNLLPVTCYLSLNKRLPRSAFRCQATLGGTKRS